MADFGSFSSVIHPAVVHFPVALILTTCALSIIYVWRKHVLNMSFTIKLLAVLSAISAWVGVISGGLTADMSGFANTVEGWHHACAIATSVLISLSAIGFLLTPKEGGQEWLKWMSLVLLLLSGAGIAATGYFGGYIVYNILL